MEYKAPTNGSNPFGGALNGAILVARYSGGKDIFGLTPGGNGQITGTLTGIAGFTGFNDPLDLTEDNSVGNIYVVEYGGQKLTLLRPIAPGGHAIVDKTTLYYNDVKGAAASPVQTITLTNTGNAPLALPSDGLSVSGTDAGSFLMVTKPTLPMTIPVGGSITVSVDYKPASTSALGIHTATLIIKTNDPSSPTINIALRGLTTAGTGGQNEPSLQRILDLYQIPVVTGDSNPADTNLYSPTEPLLPNNDEQVIQELTKANGAAPVRIVPLDAFAGGSPVVRFGYYSPGTAASKTELLTINAADAQSVNPTIVPTAALTPAAGAAGWQFDPGSKDFGLYSTFPLFGNTAYSEDALNTTELTVPNRRKVHFYPMKDAAGNVVPNAYVFASEDYINDPTPAANGNPPGAYDTNDFVGVIYNVQPANTTGGVIGLENTDGAPAPDRMIFNRIQIQPPDPKTNPDGSILQPPNNVVHDIGVERIHNASMTPLTINSLSVSGPWVIVNAPAAGTVIPAGGSLDVTLQFVAQSEPAHDHNETNGPYNPNFGGLWSGALTINSTDVSQPVTTVTLKGWWQYKSEDDMEPSLQTIVNDMFGYSTNLQSAGQSLDTGGNIQAVGEEVLSAYWTRADANLPVSAQQLGAWHGQGNDEALRYFTRSSNPNSTTAPSSQTLFTQAGADSQSMFPLTTTGAAAIGNFPTATASGNFGFRIQATYSDEKYNTPEGTDPTKRYGHRMRFYPVRDASGRVVPNTYLLCFDYYSIDTTTGAYNSNNDYQDLIFLVKNLKPSAPAIVTGLTAQPANGGIQLNWNASSTVTDPLVTGYNVYRSTSAGGTYVKITSAPVTSASYLDLTAPTSQTSYYKVTAVNNFSGESAQSAGASALRSPDTTPPAAPTGLAAASAAGGIQLGWIGNTEPDLAGYRIYRSNTAAGTFLPLNGGSLATANSFLDTSNQVGDHWYYEISAVDLSGNESGLTAPVDATRADMTPPAAPANLAVTSQTTGVRLDWSANVEPDLAGYRVYRGSSQAGPFTLVSGSTLLTAVTYTDTAVSPGVVWYYQITAVDTRGNESAASATMSGARLNSAPRARRLRWSPRPRPGRSR